jgi:hypothetical protein
MNLKITAYKTEYGIWAFDHEHQNTVAEALCNGTELVLDEYFRIGMNRDPKLQDEIEVYVSTEDFDDSDTVLSFQSTNDQGTTYLDMVLFEKVWLCPWLQSYFGYKPTELYVKLTPVNPGLKNFNKNYANPFAKYVKKNEDELDKMLEGISEEELTDFINSSYSNDGKL